MPRHKHAWEGSHPRMPHSEKTVVGARSPSIQQPPAHRVVTYDVDHRAVLEAEALYIMREVAAEFDRPVLLFSGGKDSAVLLHLAEKAFRPGPLPFRVLHIDTGHNFPETIAFRDRRVAQLGERLIVATVQALIDAGQIVEVRSPHASRNRLQAATLLNAIATHGYDAALGGARRDEERARAKERIFSFRDDLGAWDPKNQRPEVWDLYNGRIRAGEHVRVFPISNWTELDVWQYIRAEELELPSIYFAHKRQVYRRDGILFGVSPVTQPDRGQPTFEASVRYRTVGDMTCTGAVASIASTPEEVLAEIAASPVSERGQTRADDRLTEASMEDRKREGYF
jgi:sulfate adenylyltransferase subunit 2